jgi:hypothetical protein
MRTVGALRRPSTKPGNPYEASHVAGRIGRRRRRRRWSPTCVGAAHPAPAPEVEYLYDVTMRRHYNFPNHDALGYRHGICDKVTWARTTLK